MDDARRVASPTHWIGVESGWQETGGDPLSKLVSLEAWRLSTHALIIGSTGSGKTNLIHHLLAQDFLSGHSVVVLDLRGDLVSAATEIAWRAGADPRRFKVLDLREKESPLGFDPLRGSGEAYFRALGVIDAVEDQSGSWGVQLAETLRNATMLLGSSGMPLSRIEDLFYDRAFLRECLDRCSEAPVVAFWQRFDAMSDDRKATLAMPVLNKVSALFSTEVLRKVLGHPHPLDLGAQLEMKGGALLVSLAADELHGAGRMMGRIVLACVLREIFSRVGVAESKRNPVRLYVDEFENFGTEEFESVLAEGRRFALSLVLAHQTLSQLTPKMRSIVLGNVGVKAAFRCGREDSATLSKDITGDARALDLASLPRGTCELWVRDNGCVRVEVNEPIVRNAGVLSEDGRRFLRLARESWAGAESDVVHVPVRKEGAMPESSSRHAKSRMEDWLS